MNWRVSYIFAGISVLCLSCVSALAQADRHDVRVGNAKFRKGAFAEAEISYRKALVKDSTSLAAGYNLANTLYRQKNYDEAATVMGKAIVAPGSEHEADYYYNSGNIFVSQKKWAEAVDAYKKALIANPSDMDAKENYIYAKKKLEDQQKNGGSGGQNQNQDQDKDQNQDNNNGNGQDQQNNENDGQNNDNQKDNQNQGNDNQGNGDQNNPPQQGNVGRTPVKISPQQAQQMLKAIQAKEKETQDKVNKEKAEAEKSRQKEKNW